MYVDKEKSHIGDKISMSTDDSLKSSLYFDSAIQILNLFTLSEERARMNGTIHSLKNIKLDLDQFTSNVDKVVHLVDESKDHHLLYQMQTIINELQMRHNIGLYEMIKMVGYMWNKYCEQKIDIGKVNVHKDTDEDEQISDKIIKFLNENYESFRKRLCDCIATHILA